MNELILLLMYEYSGTYIEILIVKIFIFVCEFFITSEISTFYFVNNYVCTKVIFYII